MTTLDLDKKECVLCQMNIPYLNDFLSKNHTSLARKVSEDQLYITMANLLKTNKALLEGQHGIDIPSITDEQLKVHFTKHEISMVTVIMNDLRNVRSLQNAIISQKQTPSTINSYLRLSRQAISLMNKLDKIDTFKSVTPIYKFN